MNSIEREVFNKGLEDINFCRQLLQNLRWTNERPFCPKCGNFNLARLSDFRWRCRSILKHECRDYKFSITAGTPFSKCQDLSIWLRIGIVFDGFSKRSLARMYSISESTALKIKSFWKREECKYWNEIHGKGLCREEQFNKLLELILKNETVDKK